jgi:hypothetical protein
MSKVSAGWLVERGVRREYNIWKGIKTRVTDPSSPHYDRYGGRGIQMCDRWLHGEGGQRPFECFLEDIARLPRLGPSLDRIDNDGHYEPSNVRWATAKEQSFNRHNNVLVTVCGKSQPLPQWCDELGLPYSRTYQRIAKGWPVAQALGLEGRSGVLVGRPRGRKDSGPRKPRAVTAAK